MRPYLEMVFRDDQDESLKMERDPILLFFSERGKWGHRSVGSGRNQSDVIISKDDKRMPGSHQELGQMTGSRSKMTHSSQKERICRHLYF